MIFTEFSPRTPDIDSITMLRMFCEKFHSTERIVPFNSCSISSVNSSLVRRPRPARRDRPLRMRFQRQEVFRVVEAGRVGAVVGPAELRQHHLRLRVAFHDLMDLARQGATSSSEEFKGNCAWIQMLPSSSSGMNSRPRNGITASGGRHHRGEKRQRQPAMVHAALQLPQVARPQGPHEEVVAARLEFLSKEVQSTGERVSANNSAPPKAKA